MATLKKLEIEEETLQHIERMGGYNWHEQGDMRLLQAIKEFKKPTLLDRIKEWLGKPNKQGG